MNILWFGFSIGHLTIPLISMNWHCKWNLCIANTPIFCCSLRRFKHKPECVFTTKIVEIVVVEIPSFLLRLNNCEKVSKLTRGNSHRKEGSQLAWKWETLTTRLILFVVPNAFWLLWLWTRQLCDWWKLIWNNLLSFYANLVSMQITLNAFLKNTKSLCLPLNFQMFKNNRVSPELNFNRDIAVEQ